MTDILAAGVVLWRDTADGRQVAIVHRPKYDDWSLPKGKLEPGEQLWQTAIRETLEETGFTAVLGRPLPEQVYDVGGRTKRVAYWSAQVGVGDFSPHHEVDQLRWVSTAAAVAALTWPRDAALVRDWAGVADTVPLLLLRHATSVARADWAGPDELRPLTEAGRGQAIAAIDLLTAYGVTSIVTSDAERCLQTVAPFAEAAGIPAELEPALSEHGLAANPAASGDRIRALAAAAVGPTVVCSHRPVLPVLLDALGVAADAALEPAAALVIHLAEGVPVAAEHCSPAVHPSSADRPPVASSVADVR